MGLGIAHRYCGVSTKPSTFQCLVCLSVEGNAVAKSEKKNEERNLRTMKMKGRAKISMSSSLITHQFSIHQIHHYHEGQLGISPPGTWANVSDRTDDFAEANIVDME